MIRLSALPGAYLGLPVSPLELSRMAGDILRAVGLPGRSFELELTDDGAIAVLNVAFLGCTGPTNVLSFPAAEGEESLGSVSLSAETLLREADLYGQEPRRHLVRLLAHAVLHLAGLDHGERMDDLTERAIEAVCGDGAPGTM